MASSPFVDALTVQRTINAPRMKVFHAWKNPDLLREWLGGQRYQKLNAKVDFRVGGEYHLDVVSPDGNIFHLFGEYQEIVEPERLVFTWAFEHWQQDPTLVTVTLEDRQAQTGVTIVHERFHDVPMRDLHHEGWVARLGLLEEAIK